MADTLVTLEDAKKHLKIRDALHDQEVERYLVQAEAEIRSYIKKSLPDPVPAQVPAAICFLLANLYVHRGDDFAPDNADTECWAAIARMLCQLRDPAVA